MNKKATSSDARLALRDKLLGGKKLVKTQVIEVFGVELELRQPTLRAILEAQDTTDSTVRTSDMIIRYSMVPGTDEAVFDEADRDMILNWPFGEDLLKLQNAITELTGVDVGDAEEEQKTIPLKGQ